jgi:glutamate-ammonia-ligase adenylyltransferase
MSAKPNPAPFTMQIDELRRILDDRDQANEWLCTLGVVDADGAHNNLVRMATGGLTLDLLASICGQLAEHLPASSDPDRALNNLERFIAAARNPLATGSLFERDREALPILLQIFATSQHLSDLLIADNESYDLLRITEGQPVARDLLAGELCAEVATLAPDESAVMKALRRFKRRETLRIAYGDIIRSQRLDTVTRQISYLADAMVEAAVQGAWRKIVARSSSDRATPRMPRFVVLALGKLGGVELNYSSDIDLIFLYENDLEEPSRQHDTAELCERWARLTLTLLTTATELGAPYRVDLRLRPDGNSGPMVISTAAALQYYDTAGRTWERQAYVKARACAGDIALGNEFLAQLEPWIYRRYLSRADITGIKALKRRIEQRSQREGSDEHNVKTGRGGIRDIEFVIQFLQLLNGGDLPALRTGNTLEAISQLESCGCLTHQERMLLEENYSFLRKIEHRLQIMFDLQTHRMPGDPEELRRMAIRMGFTGGDHANPFAAFWSDYKQKTEVNRKILDHLLHDAFSDDTRTEPESDLVLDPEPPKDRIAAVLGNYRFQDIPQAYCNLMALSREKVRFLSTRRCRHFLAAIAPQLLQAISTTPDPDFTLMNLSHVSESLGGKGVLWELFSFHPPSLKLYVELCSSSQYLSGVLIGTPGMLDELMDSLLLDRLPTRAQLSTMLAELCQGAETLDPILHSFKNAQQLSVGVRDILGKELIESTTGALSDIAQTCLTQITSVESRKLMAKLGEPTVGSPAEEEEPTAESIAAPSADRHGKPCELAIVALGKFGGRELNYYSDLDIIFLYEADGPTLTARRGNREPVTTNQHFFSELGQRIIKAATYLGPTGKLYQIDPRLRPTGKSGALAVSLPEFERYFARGDAQLWERQALCKARIVCGTPAFSAKVLAVIHACAYGAKFQADDVAAIRDMRARLEDSAEVGNLKRGAGGLVDIEFLVQMLQLRHGHANAAVRLPGTLDALSALSQANVLSMDDFQHLSESYRFLRTIEARMRLMSTTARDDLPDDPRELAKLAGLLGYASADNLLFDCRHYTAENRRYFERLMR